MSPSMGVQFTRKMASLVLDNIPSLNIWFERHKIDGFTLENLYRADLWEKAERLSKALKSRPGKGKGLGKLKRQPEESDTIMVRPFNY